jgi:predicted aldo/keto reductase-like oxidoreductase
MVDRRKFLHIGAAAALGLSWIEASAQSSAPGIRRQVRLGRTELRVSDISFGSASSSDPELVRHALERGINYFDSAESYRWGNAEEAIGQALTGKRDQVVLSTKTKAGAHDTRADMMKAPDSGFDGMDPANSLQPRRQGHHRCTFEVGVTALAKRQGKIRFRGMSGHGSDLVVCLDYAIDKNLVDVILVAYSFGQDPTFTDRVRHTFHWAAIQTDLPRVLEEAKKKDVGVVVMKTLMGGRLNDRKPFERPGGTFAQAAFRWVLSSRTSTRWWFHDQQGSDRRVRDRLRRPEARAERLRSSRALRGNARGNYCQPGCNACAESCPVSVPIAEVLRTRMYEVDYSDHSGAHRYADLGAGATACLTCAHRACLSACPAGVPIAKLTRDAAVRLG